MSSTRTVGTLDHLHRASVKADLRTAKILQHLDIPDVAEDDIDAALDEEYGEPATSEAHLGGAAAGFGGGWDVTAVRTTRGDRGVPLDGGPSRPQRDHGDGGAG